MAIVWSEKGLIKAATSVMEMLNGAQTTNNYVFVNDHTPSYGSGLGDLVEPTVAPGYPASSGLFGVPFLYAPGAAETEFDGLEYDHEDIEVPQSAYGWFRKFHDLITGDPVDLVCALRFAGAPIDFAPPNPPLQMYLRATVRSKHINSAGGLAAVDAELLQLQFSTAALYELARRFVDIELPFSSTVRLFKNDYSPDVDMTAAHFEEADYAGYVAQSPIWSAAYLEGDNVGTRRWTRQLYRAASGAAAQNIYGWYLQEGLDTLGDVLMAERYSGAPFSMTGGGPPAYVYGAIRFTPEPAA